MEVNVSNKGSRMSTPLLGALVAAAVVIVTLFVSYFG
jgi:hypothetical protein